MESMTKYILHGGETRVMNEHNRAFYREWVKGFKNNFVPTILLIYFSRKKDEWERCEAQDRERFANYTDNHNVNFVVANIDPNILRTQIKAADVIYARGGSSESLTSALEPIKKDLKILLAGKVYAGSSAGVMALSQYACSPFSGWKEGLSILPINSVVHYSKEMDENITLFKQNHPKNTYEYLLIPETEFVVRYE